MRRQLAVLALVTISALVSACAGITDPTRDGDGDGRCQVTQGSNTRCSDTLPE